MNGSELDSTQDPDDSKITDCHDNEPELTQHLDNNESSYCHDPKPELTPNLDTNVNSDRSLHEANQRIPRFKICRRVSPNRFDEAAEIAPQSRPPSQGRISAQRINREGEVAPKSTSVIRQQGMFSAHRINDDGEMAPRTGTHPGRICLRERRFSDNLLLPHKRLSLQERLESRRGSINSSHATSSDISESGTRILLWIILGFVGFWFLAWLGVTFTGYSFIVGPRYCDTGAHADQEHIDNAHERKIPVVKEREMHILEREMPDEDDPADEGKRVIQRHETIKINVGGYERNGGYGRGGEYGRQERHYEPERARGRDEYDQY